MSEHKKCRCLPQGDLTSLAFPVAELNSETGDVEFEGVWISGSREAVEKIVKQLFKDEDGS